MKKIVALLAMAVGIQAYACTQYEAQVIGVITEKIELNNGESCAVKADFNRVNSSIVCPLDRSELNDQFIFIKRCKNRDFEVGQRLAGVIIASDKGIYLEQRK